MTSRRGPIKVSGLVASGKVQVRPTEDEAVVADSGADQGATPQLSNGPSPNSLPQPFVQPSNSDSSGAAADSANGGVQATQFPAPSIPSVESVSQQASNVTQLPGGNAPADGEHCEVLISKIITQPKYQTRVRLVESHVEGLCRTFQSAGQRDPVKLRFNNGMYELLRGHHRLEAAKRLSWTTIKAIVVVMSDREALRDSMLGNAGHLGESDYERATAYRNYIKEGFAKTQQEVADAYGVSKGRVSQVMNLLDLPQKILELLDKYPKLLSYRGAMIIKDLLKEHPQHEDIIFQGVERLVETLDGESGDATGEASLKQWIVQKIQLLNAKDMGTTTETHVVTNNSGSVRFQTKTKGRKIIVDLKDDLDDPQEIERKVKELLTNIPERAREND